MSTECQPTASKRPRLTPNDSASNGEANGGKEAAVAESPSLSLLRSLRPTRVLTNRSHDKFVALLAKHGDEEETDALILLEKTPFPSDVAAFGRGPPHWAAAGEEVMQNDIYSKLTVDTGCSVGAGSVKATVIHPATPRLIAKYEEQTLHLLRESWQLYQDVVRPYVEKTRHSLAWVHNILNGTAEQDRVLLADDDPLTGFVLSADLKWDGRTPEDMYCLSLVRRTDLASLRDLTAEHLPLLRRVGEEGRRELSQRLGIAASQLRVYLHYPPSFYHLHVHFTFAGTPVAGSETERAHLLDSVIANLELLPDYYQRAELTVGVREKDQLFGLMVGARK